MYVVLNIWTEGEITVEEAVITFVLFFVLIALAFLADRLNARRKRKRKKKEQEDSSKLAEPNHPLGTPRSLDSSR